MIIKVHINENFHNTISTMQPKSLGHDTSSLTEEILRTAPIAITP